jgi:hypothetical protein
MGRAEAKSSVCCFPLGFGSLRISDCIDFGIAAIL